MKRITPQHAQRDSESTAMRPSTRRWQHLRLLLIACLLIGWGLQETMSSSGRANAAPPPNLSAADWSAIRRLVPFAVSQQAYAKASNTNAEDQFGYSVAISEDTVVIGAPGEDSIATGVDGDQSDNSAPRAGAVYVLVRDGYSWSQQAYLKASNTQATDHFGSSVAISGNTIVVGSPHEDSAATGVNGQQNNEELDGAGAAYVFVRSGPYWSQQAYLKASNTGAFDLFGTKVAIADDTIVVGAYGEDSAARTINGDQNNNAASASGAAYVFGRSGTTWSQQAYLKASNSDALDFFGVALTISANTIIVGAPQEASAATGINGDQNNNAASMAGAAYVFVRSGMAWSQQAYLKASNTDPNDNFGWSVAISGERIVVGAYNEASSGSQPNNGAPGAGAAYVFVRTGTIWSQQSYVKASSTEASDHFGVAVAISGDILTVGAYQEDSNARGINGNMTNNNARDSGAVYMFAWTGAIWIRYTYVKASNADPLDQFGFSIALSGMTVVVGAYNEASATIGINNNPDNNDWHDAGAAYVVAGNEESTPIPTYTPTPLISQTPSTTATPTSTPSSTAPPSNTPTLTPILNETSSPTSIPSTTVPPLNTPTVPPNQTATAFSTPTTLPNQTMTPLPPQTSTPTSASNATATPFTTPTSEPSAIGTRTTIATSQPTQTHTPIIATTATSTSLQTATSRPTISTTEQPTAQHRIVLPLLLADAH